MRHQANRARWPWWDVSLFLQALATKEAGARSHARLRLIFLSILASSKRPCSWQHTSAPQSVSEPVEVRSRETGKWSHTVSPKGRQAPSLVGHCGLSFFRGILKLVSFCPNSWLRRSLWASAVRRSRGSMGSTPWTALTLL